MTLSIDKILKVWYSALFPHIQRDRRRSAVKQKTLQELSELALRVAGKMASLEKVVTPEAFDELREDINWLDTESAAITQLDLTNYMTENKKGEYQE